ncbi:hypothetical protein [Paenibacillus sp. HJGM_3]|uniref:hypothetical protein n=1 Tax=Paenibacillus sp. HJGM_3 TaxID=3379816 RepID=UPI00385B7F17
MSDGQLKAFERNNYFYGKLLTVRDFQTEQDYFNEKRQLLNRLVHGAGIVCGLHTEIVDNRGVRLDPGVAIDGWGREIVVGRELLKTDIRELTGYPLDEEGPKTLYLSLEYDETAKEPVPALVNECGCEDITESNRILECYKLTLTVTPPGSEPGWSSLWNGTSVLYQKGKLKLERTAPRWVKGEDVFEVVIKLTTLQTIASEEVWEAEVAEELPEDLILLHSQPMRFVVSNAEEGTVIENRYVVRAGSVSGPYSIGGKLRVSGNGGTAEEKRTPSNSVTVFTEKAVSEKAVELHFAEQKNEDLAGAKKPGVLLAALTINEDGLITRLNELGRRYVYNNPLLGRLVKFEEDRIGKLPFHGLSHGAEGEDPLNVTDLHGLLADPQWVEVFTEGNDSIRARRFSFEGAGVQVDTNPEADDHVRVRISGVAHADTHEAGGSDPIDVTNLQGVLAEPQKLAIYTQGDNYVAARKLSFAGTGIKVEKGPFGNDHIQVSINGATPHAKSHEAGGTDSINVKNLPGVLAEPQKVNVGFAGNTYIANGIRFSGSGATAVMNNGFLQVDITGGEAPLEGIGAVSGRVAYTKVGIGETRISPYIEIPFKGPVSIQTALEFDFTGIIGSIVGADANLSVIYDLNKKHFRIVLQDAHYENSGVREFNYTVRYWIIPSASFNPDVEAEAPGVPWYKEYVLSRIYMTGGASLEQLKSYQLLWNADQLEEVLKELENEGYVKRDGDYFYLTF